MKRFFGLFVAAMTLAGCNASPPTAPVFVDGQRLVNRQVVAVSGQPVRVAFATSLNPDCSVQGEVTPRLTTAPEHGTLTFVKTTDFAHYLEPNPRTACNTKRVEGVRVEYRSAPGYLGDDQVVYDMFFPGGQSNHVTAHITVK